MILKILNDACKEILKDKKQVLIVLTGLHASGKSTIAKQIRKNGLENFKPYEIVVIDDNVMSLNLFFARPKIKINADHQDELRPFLKFIMPFVKIVIYASTHPLSRISRCDILCVLKADEKDRLERIYKRNSRKNRETTQKQIDKKELELTGLLYKFKFEFESLAIKN